MFDLVFGPTDGGHHGMPRRLGLEFSFVLSRVALFDDGGVISGDDARV